MSSLPRSLKEVLVELDSIIEERMACNSSAAVFAYVYRRTTREIEAGISEGVFEDPDRMEAFDVIFANLYIEAYRKWRAGERVSGAWQLAFDADTGSLTLIQHLLLGMNAHINLDLGIAASRVMKGRPILDLESDFHRVNDILFRLTDEMQDRLGRVSPLMILLDWIGKRSDERIVDFSLEKARAYSWKNALRLWETPGEELPGRIATIDGFVSGIGEIIKQPRSRISRAALWLIKKFEDDDVPSILDRLRW